MSFFDLLISSGNASTGSNPSIVDILIIGDSIANGTSNGIGNVTSGELFEYNEGGFVQITEDTLDANTGSPYPAMANKFSEYNKIVYLLEHGSGGSEFSPNPSIFNTNNWSEDGVLYNQMKTDADAYLLLRDIDKFSAIIINCGINDAIGAIDLNTIESDAQSLISRLNTDFPNTTIVINQLGKSPADSGRVTAIRGYIDDLVTNNSFVIDGFDLDTLDASYYYDGLHLNQSGNDLMGEALAVIVNSL